MKLGTNEFNEIVEIGAITELSKNVYDLEEIEINMLFGSADIDELKYFIFYPTKNGYHIQFNQYKKQEDTILEYEAQLDRIEQNTASLKADIEQSAIDQYTLELMESGVL